MKFIDLQTLNRLKDIAIDVSKRKYKNTMGQMFCVETAFVKKSLLDWFDKKFKSENLEIPGLMKMIYKQKNSINWKKDKCVICKMPLKFEPTSFEMPDDEMTYGDFVIRFEHKFIRNIYTIEQIKQSDDLKCLENHYKTYQKFISILIGLLTLFNNYNINDEVNIKTSEFIEESFANDVIDKLKNRVMQTEIKNALKTSFSRVPKFNLKIYAFDYDWLVYFPKSGIQYETFTTNSFFVNALHLVKMKVYLHHSHITGKIIGYTHDFCNARVKENNMEIPVIAHNLFGFDLYYFIKGYIASAWCSKELKIGENNLTQINFFNIAGEIKFTDSLKYYQKG